MSHFFSLDNYNSSYSKKSRISRIILSLVILLTGGLIYVIYRDKSLLMFNWFDSLGISKQVDCLRDIAQGGGIYDWVKYSLPDGLWIFSYMFIIDAIWNGERNALSFIFIYGLPFIAILSEFLQCFGLCPGVFDWKDLASYVFAIMLFLIIKLLK